MPDAIPRFVDYHCHLDLYPDYEAQFANCSEQMVATLAVTTTPRAWPRNRELSEESAFVRVGLGLHPQLVADRSVEFRLFEKHFSESRFIGEVGLDASPRYYGSYREQKEIFERVLRLCAEHGNKILSVHSVRATRDVLTFIEKLLPAERSRVVLHWFGGTKAEGKLAAELGCYFSVNAEMLNKDPRRAVVATLPLTRILTETDGPFTKTFDQPSRPADVSRVIPLLGSLFNMGAEEIRKQLIANLYALETA